jgi:hypothetical protein
MEKLKQNLDNLKDLLTLSYRIWHLKAFLVAKPSKMHHSQQDPRIKLEAFSFLWKEY